MVVLDTNIIIDHLRQTDVSESLLIKVVKKMTKQNLALSVISIQELYEGISTKIQDKEERLLAVITPLRILSYTYEIAQLAGEIARDLKCDIEFADAAIATTAIINGASLLTLNQRHFKDIADLEMLNM